LSFGQWSNASADILSDLEPALDKLVLAMLDAGAADCAVGGAV
jgi:hypothetical protein